MGFCVCSPKNRKQLIVIEDKQQARTHVHAVEKLCGWEMELNHHGMSPDRSTTDCATIQPIAGLFIFIYVLSASADTTFGYFEIWTF